MYNERCHGRRSLLSKRIDPGVVSSIFQSIDFTQHVCPSQFGTWANLCVRCGDQLKSTTAHLTTLATCVHYRTRHSGLSYVIYFRYACETSVNCSLPVADVTVTSQFLIG